MWDLIVSVPDHCLSFYLSSSLFWYWMQLSHIIYLYSSSGLINTIYIHVVSRDLRSSSNFNFRINNFYLSLTMLFSYVFNMFMPRAVFWQEKSQVFMYVNFGYLLIQHK